MSCSFQLNLIDNAGVQFSVILMSKSQSCSLLPAQLSRWCNVRAVRNQSGVMFRECDVRARACRATVGQTQAAVSTSLIPALWVTSWRQDKRTCIIIHQWGFCMLRMCRIFWSQPMTPARRNGTTSSMRTQEKIIIFALEIDKILITPHRTALAKWERAAQNFFSPESWSHLVRGSCPPGSPLSPGYSTASPGNTWLGASSRPGPCSLPAAGGDFKTWMAKVEIF